MLLNNRNYIVAIASSLDFIFVSMLFWTAFYLRYLDVSISFDYSIFKLWVGSTLVSLVVVGCLLSLKAYSHLNRNLDFSIFFPLTLGCLSGFFVITFYDFFFTVEIPRSIPIIHLLLNVIGLTSLRISYRAISRRLNFGPQEPIIIFGAGATGRRLFDLISNDHKFVVVGFVDDDIGKRSSVISGVKVFSREKVSDIYHRLKVRKVLLCIPNASYRDSNEVSRFFVGHGFGVLTIPRIDELLAGKANLEQPEILDIANLTGRDEVERESAHATNIFNGSAVLVTGAGGSIGAELCRQLSVFELKKLVLIDVSEFALFRIFDELKDLNIDRDALEIIPVLGSIIDKSLLSQICHDYDIDTFFHAAAYKHVPLVECNVNVAIKNNVIGSKNCVEVAIDQRVKRFVLVSSDKAVRPTNIMGATKRMAELIVQSKFSETQYSSAAIVRFGNVLNSSGSVIPIFRSQIARGGPVTVTDPKITRFFMTISEASQLIIHCSSLESNGDVFVLDMGEPVKINDLAKRMISLSGLSLKDNKNPNGDIEIIYTGIRPGEKMHEELALAGSLLPTSNAKVLKEIPEDIVGSEITKLVDALELKIKDGNTDALKRLLTNPYVNYVSEAGS